MSEPETNERGSSNLELTGKHIFLRNARDCGNVLTKELRCTGRVGHLNIILVRESGNLNDPILSVVLSFLNSNGELVLS